MADGTSNGSLTIELHGFLAERLAALGHRRGTRTLVEVNLDGASTVASLLSRLVDGDDRYTLLFDRENQSFPEHVEVVLNDRVVDLQGGVNAALREGDRLSFLPAHAGG
jgi:molybdopterin converting factor small subunit